MKVIISLLFFSVVCSYSASAQTVSSQKNPQLKEVNDPVPPVPASTTATLVSGTRNPVITEVPAENKAERTEQKPEVISSERKPK